MNTSVVGFDDFSDVAGQRWWSWLRRRNRPERPSGINGKIVFVRDGARDSHIFMIKALKDWKRGATAGLLDAPRITLEAEAGFRLLLVPIYWMFLCSSKSEAA
jgi:hypothetical protein